MRTRRVPAILGRIEWISSHAIGACSIAKPEIAGDGSLSFATVAKEFPAFFERLLILSQNGNFV